MKKQIIRLTENDLHQIIRNTVKSIIRENLEDERHVLKLHSNEDSMDEPPMMPPPPPMNEPMGGDPSAPPMGDEPPMDDSSAPPMGDEPPSGGEPPMDEPNDGDPEIADDKEGGNQEIDDIFNSLGIEDQSAVLKYAKSMANDNNNEPTDMPMESKRYSNLDRIIEDVLGREVRGKDRTSKRNSKDVSNETVSNSNPFISKR